MSWVESWVRAAASCPGLWQGLAGACRASGGRRERDVLVGENQKQPLATVPSQSSSMPLQISVDGVPGSQVCDTPLTQFSTVRSQAPTPQVVEPRPSSTDPSQSSSIPLQVSVDGVPGAQVCGTPPTQFCTVRSQAPTPQVVEPRSSSTDPSQSSSMPLQTSVEGVPGGRAWGSPPTHS